MHLLKQSTAVSTLVGPVLDANGAAYASMAIADFNITKNGSTAAMASAATATHSHNGHYIIALTTGNTDTLGQLEISCNKTTYSMGMARYTVLTAATFDAFVTNAAGAANGLFIAGTNAATTITTSLTTHLVGTVDTVTTLTNLPAITTNWLTGTGTDASAVTKIQSGLATPTNITSASGVSLASTGLNAITATVPTAVATTFPQMLVQLWWRFFGNIKKATSGTTIKTYRADDTTVITTQSYTDDGSGNETIGAAS